ncbi:hypothetical protein AvCA_11160 [Azotobacter vinelandii CA]|uniref:DUF2231 domain-containing protein n=3 Tax=Azotobacter TaxID=352 RepID=C1DPB4_AZOVD|nr:conserved hypothetical protein [Azotobacter vinelandii DJ]AGK17080.1 hypothetical protein AvCA_11160 [Azotobacter vinelandii CA]AGK19738.1 hypothetical protein AvCA6_11160 [Azotobacter vinelandii CA6]
MNACGPPPFSAQEVSMPEQTIRSRAALGGHPLHPMMIHFPVAALVGLLASDLGYLLSGDPFWARASLWLSGIGAFGGWIASIAGMIDLFGVRRIRRLVTGWCHALLAVMMLSLASLNWLQRHLAVEHIFPWGLYLSALTALLIVLAAWLGGRLVYEHAVGVDVES